MRCWIFEDTIGGGRWRIEANRSPLDSHLNPNDLSTTLQREGRAMVEAIVSAASPKLRRELRVAWDSQVPDPPSGVRLDGIDSPQSLERWFERACLDSSKHPTESGILLIAPETGGCLLHWTALVESLGGRLVSPNRSFVELASDKTLTQRRLRDARVATPHDPATHSTSKSGWIIKPRDGCGSQAIQHWPNEKPPEPAQWPRDHWHIESFCPGQATSVACLASNGSIVLLPPMTQQLASDGSFSYEGGSYPLPKNEARRVSKLALQAVRSLPPTCGYFGMDIVLGKTQADDVVIEVNPRLTTSFVGLAHCVSPDLTDAMLFMAIQGRLPKLRIDPRPLQFDSSGNVTGVS